MKHSSGAANAELVCVSGSILGTAVVLFGDLRLSVWPEDAFSVIHIAAVNSAGRKKCGEHGEKEDRNIHVSLISLNAIHGLQLCNTLQLCSPKNPFSISRCYSASSAAAL